MKTLFEDEVASLKAFILYAIDKKFNLIWII